MKKEELIAKLNELPDNIEVCIYDHRMMSNRATEDPCSDGLYSNFEVSLDDDWIASGKKVKIAVLAFNNPDYNEDGSFNEHNFPYSKPF